MEDTAYEKVGSALAENQDRLSDVGPKMRYGIDDKPSVIPAFFFAVQHVLIMFSAMIASPLIIGQLLGLSPELRGALTTGVILGCGIGTVISALGVGWVGARLPLLLGL
jgi:xanthine/uracil permease